MDAAQITGAASSYARKYAMNALFAIDDTKDADTNQYRDQAMMQATPKPTATRRTKAVAAPTPAQPTDRFSAIRSAINSTNSVDELLSLYQLHSSECENNPSIKKLFTDRKNQLNKAA
jgi:hypothetical protein